MNTLLIFFFECIIIYTPFYYNHQFYSPKPENQHIDLLLYGFMQWEVNLEENAPLSFPGKDCCFLCYSQARRIP